MKLCRTRAEGQRGMDEAVLVERARRGDRAALTVLLERCVEPSLHVAMRILASREDAEDAVQSALQKACGGIGEFRGGSAFTTWFTSIVVRCCLDLDRRRKAGPPTVPFDPSVHENSTLARDESLARLLGTERRARIERELQRLPVRIRSALVLRTLHEMAYADVAETLGITVRTARMYVFEARRELARCLPASWEDERE